MRWAPRLFRAIKSPVVFLRALNRVYHTQFRNHDGVDVFAEDWDNLLILDACRYDLFTEHSTLPGQLEPRSSAGSATFEFLMENLADRDLRDVVFVTANPQLRRNWAELRPRLHAVVDVWAEDGWDEDEGTVLPETVTKYALEAASDYPDKRLVVHYMQPHYPFVGSGTEFDKHHLESEDGGKNVWEQAMSGELDIGRKALWELYAQNLEVALPHVEELMIKLGGKTVVTSDHGNFVGERASPVPIREWGHPRGIYTDELVKVPWLVFENGPRRDVVLESDEETPSGVDTETVEDRLRDLGYMN